MEEGRRRGALSSEGRFVCVGTVISDGADAGLFVSSSEKCLRPKSDQLDLVLVEEEGEEGEEEEEEEEEVEEEEGGKGRGGERRGEEEGVV